MEIFESHHGVALISVPHNAYLLLDESCYCSNCKSTARIADLKGIMRNKITQRTYRTL